jgi:hypothetical protein
MPYRTAVVALMLALAFFTPASFASQEPPKKFGDIAAIRRWVEGSKGFGVPQYAEFTLSGCHVLVAWNSPFPGPASNFVYAYRELASAKGWELVDFSFFPQPEFLSHAYMDARSGMLVYVSGSGKELKSLPMWPSTHDQ